VQCCGKKDRVWLKAATSNIIDIEERTVLVDEALMSDADKYNENCQKNHHEFVQGVQVYTLHAYTCTLYIHVHCATCLLYTTTVYASMHARQLLYT
jgi:hypothetical protein